MSDLIQLDSLPVETLAEMANEAAAACEASGRKTVEHAIRCGRALLAAKAVVPHGEWAAWLGEHFEHSGRLARKYIEIANWHGRANLEDANSLGDALRIIADSPEKQAKKQEREAKKQERQPEKTEAPPKPPEPAPAPPAPPAKLERPAWLADPDELERPEEDDLPPLPRTNTHHTAANRRTPDARERDRVGIVPPDDPRTYHDGHWYAWSEDRGRMVAVTDEEILRRADEIRGQAVAEPVVTTTPVVEHKRDSVSHKPGKVPTLLQLRQAVYAKTEWGDALRQSAMDWAGYKMTLAGKDKIRSMESWQKALTRMGNVARDRSVADVCEAIEKAIANGWTGWEHLETGNDRKLRGAVGGRVYQQLQKAEVKYDPLPE